MRAVSNQRQLGSELFSEAFLAKSIEFSVLSRDVRFSVRLALSFAVEIISTVKVGKSFLTKMLVFQVDVVSGKY